MEFKVPLEKHRNYPVDLFNFLSRRMHEMSVEYGKWPDCLKFNGRLGEEIFDVIKDQGWDFDKFTMSVKSNNPLNQLIIEYRDPIKMKTQVSIDGKTPSLRGSSMNEITAKGIISDQDAAKIAAASISNSFNLEKNIRPSVKIKLSR